MMAPRTNKITMFVYIYRLDATEKSWFASRKLTKNLHLHKKTHKKIHTSDNLIQFFTSSQTSITFVGKNLIVFYTGKKSIPSEEAGLTKGQVWSSKFKA